MITKLLSEQIDAKIQFIDNYIHAENAADGSNVDANANVTSKNVATLRAELYKDFTVQLNTSMMYNKLNKMFDESTAKMYLHDLQNHFIYQHDASNPICSYCASVSLYPFLLDGLTKLGGETKAPKHAESFCDGFTQLISTLASQFSGAIASPEVFLCLDHFFTKDYGRDYINTHEKIIENHLQSIVYNMNHPAAARGSQSVFWNVAIFDKNFASALFKDFMFPDGTMVNFESFYKLQKFFLSWIRKERTKALLTFPVITVAVLNEGNTVEDHKFVDFCADELSQGNEFFVYQSDTVDALSSCCFTGNTEVMLSKDGDMSTVVSFEKAYDIVSKWNTDMICYTFHRGKWIKAKLIRVENDKPIVRIYFKSDTRDYVDCTTDHRIVTPSGDKSAAELQVGDPVCTHVFFQRDKQEQSIHNVIRKVPLNNIPKYTYCFQVEQGEPYFTLPNGMMVHNCRLKNPLDKNEFNYTLGNIGVQTGSVCVMTLNVNRFVQKAWEEYSERGIYKYTATGNKIKNNPNFREALKEKLIIQVDRIHRNHAAFRAMLEELEAANMLPAYTAGFISMNKQFSTIGINGMVEAAEFLGITPDNNEDYITFVDTFLHTIADTNVTGGKKYGIKFNTEFVPAENLGVKNAKWDHEDGYHTSRKCYNSYFYPVESNMNIIDKFVLHGKRTTEHLDGGSALHLNFDDRPSKEQYRKLFDLACLSGCYYWTTNIITSICNTCGLITKQKLTDCQSCGSSDIDYATRIIGYLRRIKNFSAARQTEFHTRLHHHISDV